MKPWFFSRMNTMRDSAFRAAAMAMLIFVSLLQAACGGGGGGGSGSSAATVNYTLTVSGAGSFGTIVATVSGTPSGISCGSVCTASYAAGTTVVLTQTPTAGYAFSGWGGGYCSGTATTCLVTMSQARTVTASYIASSVNYTLSVTASRTGTATGSVSSNTGGIACGYGNTGTCSASYLTGTSVILTAAPGSNSGVTWGGACAGVTTTTCTVSMGSAKSVTAAFAAPKLTVSNAGGGNGSVTSTAGGFTCTTSNTAAGTCTATVCSAGTCTATPTAGSAVTLTAAPASGFTFTGWSGDCSGTSTTCTLTMSGARSATAIFDYTATCVQSGSSTTLATIITNSSGTATTNSKLSGACPIEPSANAVTGACYGNYAVQSNSYSGYPANMNFSMWSNSASCWGINITQPLGTYFWNAPLVTRGFSFGVNSPLIPLPAANSGGILVSDLNTVYASTSTHCPTTGTSGSVCAKWSMAVPGVSSQSIVNTSTNTYTNWDALLDIYFHSTANPAHGSDVTFDLQIYQMLMDYQVGGNPNWASYLLGTWTKKTIGGNTYLVSVNMQDPGTENNWVGNGGTYKMISMFLLPTYPTSAAGSKSYLWGQASATHDVGGIIAWLSQVETRSGVTGIFDDAGARLYDNVAGTAVSTPLIDPTYYLTGLNPSFEVVGSPANGSYPNNKVFNTTNFWVAIPGEAVGN